MDREGRKERKRRRKKMKKRKRKRKMAKWQSGPAHDSIARYPST